MQVFEYDNGAQRVKFLHPRQYVFQKPAGRGAYGEVLAFRDATSEDSALVAIKRISWNDMFIPVASQQGTATLAQKTRSMVEVKTAREIALLFHLRGHINVIELYDVYADVRVATKSGGSTSTSGKNITESSGSGSKKAPSTTTTTTTTTGEGPLPLNVEYESVDVYLVMEYMPFDLYSFVRKHAVLSTVLNQHTGGSVTSKENQAVVKKGEQSVKIIIYQVLRGLATMHDCGLVHRDIKPQNILIGDNAEVRLSDFGLSRPQSEVMTRYVVTRWYRAPENTSLEDHYDTTTDIFSVGCVMAELYLGKPLFDRVPVGTTEKTAHNMSLPPNNLRVRIELLGRPPDERVRSIFSSKMARWICSEFKCEPIVPFKDVFTFSHPSDPGRSLPVATRQALDLLSKMLQFDPADRITARAAMAHPFFASVREAVEKAAKTNGCRACTNMPPFQKVSVGAAGAIAATSTGSSTPPPTPHVNLTETSAVAAAAATTATGSTGGVNSGPPPEVLPDPLSVQQAVQTIQKYQVLLRAASAEGR